MNAGTELRYALSVDAGGSMTKMAVVDSQGQIVHKAAVSTDKTVPPDAVPDWLVRLLNDLRDQAEIPEQRIAGVCVGIPGVIDRRTDMIISCPNLVNWEGMPLAVLLQERTGLPTYIEKDANLAALGERWLGAAQGVDHAVCFTIGTGIGTGIIIGGRLYHGALGGAGEIGHIIVMPDGPRCNCGNRGCLEALASATAIVREARAALERDPSSRMWRLAGGDAASLTAEMVFTAAREGDYTAGQIVSHALDYLGIGVASIVNVFNPDMVVLGGGVALAGEQVLTPVRHVVRQRARTLLAEHVQVVCATLGDMAGVIGGAHLVFDSQDIPTSASPLSLVDET